MGSETKIAWPLKAEVAALVLAMLVQAATAVWWASAQQSRLATLEKAVQTLIDNQATDARQSEDIARIDERTRNILETIARVERQLNKE